MLQVGKINIQVVLSTCHATQTVYCNDMEVHMKKSKSFIGIASLVGLGIFSALYVCTAKGQPQTMYVSADVCKVRSGAGEEFDTVGLLAKEAPVLVLDKTIGKDAQSWYRIDKVSLPEDSDIPTEEYYIRSDLLVKK